MNSISLHSSQLTLKQQNRFQTSEITKRHPSFASSLSLLVPAFSDRFRLKRNSTTTIVAAAKKESSNKDNNRNRKKKDDKHSFVSRPDEAIGPYPESLLLKERKVEEDGRLMPEFADMDERELFDVLNLQLESDTAVDNMRHYEVVYLIHEDHKEEVENVNVKIQEFLKEKKGKIWRFSDWGMRRLAYKIQKAKSAHYILMNFEIEAKWINDFKTMLDRDERIIRHLVMRKDEAETWDCPPPPEFNSLRSDMNDDDDDYDEDEDEDEEEEEEEEEEYDDDENDDAYIGNENERIIYVDADDDVVSDKDSNSSRKSKPKVQTVGR